MRTIHRKTQTSNFTVLPNALLQDAALSFRARGLLVMMLSMPDDWKTYQTWLEEQGREGKEAIRAVIRELEAAGYLRRDQIREKGRLCGQTWHWSDTPSAGKPASGNLDCTKYPSVPKSKESEGTTAFAAVTAAEILPPIAPVCKRSALSQLSKEEQLARLPNLEDFPSEDEFEDFLHEEDLLEIMEARPELYLELCDRKWRHWRTRLNKWVPILNWKAYILALNETIRNAGGPELEPL